jgi:D-glycero-D-manno-heptose 1,7-bisphosphate phosphatase
VAEAVARLRGLGLLVIVVTNQPDLARGSLTRDALDAMHARLRAAVPVDDVAVCPHDDADGCSCRKPRPGLLLAAAARWGIDLAGSFLVGDRGKDIEAGRQAGCTTILVPAPYSGAARADHRAADLTEAAEIISRLITTEGERPVIRSRSSAPPLTVTGFTADEKLKADG